jgi:Pin2-interacting protein X1
MLGIGADHTKDPNGVAWKQNRDFENLLKRLNADSEGPTEDGADPAPIDGFQPAYAQDPADTTNTGPNRRDENEKMEERKSKKTKRLRIDDETEKVGERKSKKQKQVGSAACEPVEAGPSGSNSPTPETISFVVIDRSREKTPTDPWIQHLK